MRNTFKGGLISAFIFPGVGHLAIGANRRGWILLILTLIAVGLLVGAIVPVAMSVATDITRGTVSLNPIDMQEVIHERLAVQGGSRLFYGTAAFIALWTVALLDVIRTGRLLDRAASS